MRKWSMPEVEKIGLEQTQGNPGHGGRDSYMTEDKEKEFERECGPTGSGCPFCN